MDQRFAYSPADLARVKCVQFGIISPDEIVSHSEPLFIYLLVVLLSTTFLFLWLGASFFCWFC
jgi:hypothetical protein